MKFLYRTINSLQKFDWSIFILVVILISVGLASIYSIDLSKGEELSFFPTQITALTIGLVVFFLASFLHTSIYYSSAKPVYFLSLFLLVLVLFFGLNIRGTTGWFRFGGFSFQPAELAKIGLIIFLAWWISKQSRCFERWQFILTSGFFTFLPVILIMLQPDLGSALVLFSIWFGLLFLTGTKKRYILILFSVLVMMFLMGWTFLFQDYQKDRLLTFLDPARDPLGAGYNVSQSIIAIGSGNFFGRGLGFGSQSQMHFLPEAQTDFIFSVIAEELGFVGVFIVLSIYFLLLWRLYSFARKEKDEFCVYLLLGIILMYFIQFFINIGGATGLLPVTGVTLPFLSYGGSSLIINFLLLGIAESVIRNSRSA